MTTGQSDDEEFARSLDGLVDEAVANIDGRGKTQGEKRDEGELIEYAAHLTYLLHAPGYRANELSVSLLGGELVVAGPDFTLRKPVSFEGACTVTATYINGVLCARVEKAS